MTPRALVAHVAGLALFVAFLSPCHVAEGSNLPRRAQADRDLRELERDAPQIQPVMSWAVREHALLAAAAFPAPHVERQNPQGSSDPSCTASAGEIVSCQKASNANLAKREPFSSGSCCAVPSQGTVYICVKTCCYRDNGPGKVLIPVPDQKCETSSGTTAAPSTTTRPANATNVPRASPSSATANNTSATCFARNALVELENGKVKRMDDLRIGDRVKVAPGVYSDVFMFTHSAPDVTAVFVAIRTSSGHSITLTPGHYLYVNSALVPAGTAKIGDEVTLGHGPVSTVVSVTEIVEVGLYNPQTIHGDIVVDGVVASTYTTAVSPTFGHAWLAPMRALYASFGVGGGMLANGADGAVQLLPSGPLAC